MSDIDHMMKASTQSAPEAKPIEHPGGGFNAAPLTSKNDFADGEAEMPRSKVTDFPCEIDPAGWPAAALSALTPPPQSTQHSAKPDPARGFRHCGQ